MSNVLCHCLLFRWSGHSLSVCNTVNQNTHTHTEGKIVFRSKFEFHNKNCTRLRTAWLIFRMFCLLCMLKKNSAAANALNYYSSRLSMERKLQTLTNGLQMFSLLSRFHFRYRFPFCFFFDKFSYFLCFCYRFDDETCNNSYVSDFFLFAESFKQKCLLNDWRKKKRNESHFVITNSNDVMKKFQIGFIYIALCFDFFFSSSKFCFYVFIRTLCCWS